MITADLNPFRLFVCLACASSLNACSSLPSSAGASSRSFPKHLMQAQREKSLQSDWRGKPYNALIESFGAPEFVMNVPGYRQLPTSVAVYGVTDDISQCVDAFTLVSTGSEDVFVADYFCR